VDGTPECLHYKELEGYSYAYEDWSGELKDEYAYDPEGARELLADAGHPGGFATNAVATSAFDLELLQIIKSYFMDIGVDMEIKTFDMQSWMGVTHEGKFDQMVYTQESGMTNGILMNLRKRHEGFRDNYTFNNDPTYEAMYDQFFQSATVEDAKRVASDMEKYALEQHWAVNTFSIGNPVLWQPWVKGYSGEFIGFPYTLYYARVWIDQDMKPQ
jgi:peptide/nickel transport system substrate-binding protein